MGIVAKVYDGANPSTLIATLTKDFNRGWLDLFDDVGSGQTSIHRDDPQLAAHPTTLLKYRNIVRFQLDGTDRFAFINENRNYPPAPENEHEGAVWSLNGRGVLGLLDDAIVYPETGPFGVARQRRFDWTAIAYDDSAWIAATQIQQQGSGGDEVRWHNQPAGWPPYHTGVYWIWSRAKDAPYPAGKMPVGTSYFRRQFTLASDVTVQVSATCDNQFQLFLDGDPLLEGDDWSQTYQTKIPILAGTHELAAMCTNVDAHAASPAAPGGPAGFLFLMLQLDDANATLGTPILVSDSSWICLDYPASVPGMSIGQIWRLLIDEAQTRGCFPGITLGFTDTLDTNSNAWSPADPNIALDIGTKYLDVFRTFQEQFIDGEMTPTLVLNFYNKGTFGSDLTGTVSLTIGGATDPQKMIANWNTEGQIHRANVALARDTLGELTEVTNSGSLASHVRIENYYELALAPSLDRAAAMATEILVEAAYPTIKVSGRLTANAGPYSSWRPGDTILTPGPASQVATTMMSITVSEDAVGNAIFNAEGMQDDAAA